VPPSIPGFAFGDLLGRGGMGEVWSAHQDSLDREVAVKLLPAAAVSPEATQRFRREAEAMARIRHPHLVEVYDAGGERFTDVTPQYKALAPLKLSGDSE